MGRLDRRRKNHLGRLVWWLVDGTHHWSCDAHARNCILNNRRDLGRTGLCPCQLHVVFQVLDLLIGDLTHAIVKRGCRDADVLELCDRLEYVQSSGDGTLFYAD
jgi:hypothetical protein